VTGWRQLMEEVKVAATFEQIRDAGERQPAHSPCC
jgi:hypothetical protein